MDGVSIHRFRYAPEALETLVQDGGILANLNRSYWKWGLVPFFFVGLMLACSQRIKQICPHAIHAHWIIPQGLAIALLSVFSRSLPPFLITSHGGDLFGLQARLFQLLKRWVLRRASAITVVSQPMVDAVVKLGAAPEQTSVIPMGVDFSHRFSVDRGIQRIAGQILFVGRLVEKKGVKYLIEALPAIRAQVPGAHLVVVGGGPELGALTAQVYELGLNDCVEFRGPLPQGALPDLYRRASVFVAPFIDAGSGDKEGLGLVTIEAIACGCPVVVGDVAVVADIFLDTEMAMRATPGDPDSLAAKIKDVLLVPDMALQRTAAVRERLQQRLGWQSIAGSYGELLRNLGSRA
jgi:glycosyltransferase involved in cell wall biosynthesis